VTLRTALAQFTRPFKPHKRAAAVARDAGFTLLELLVVLGIIAMLATVATPQVLRYREQARQNAAQAQIASINTALELYVLDVGSFPPQQAGLAALMQAPANSPSWRGPYLKGNGGLIDPWGRPYNYKFPGSRGGPDVYTLGRDGAGKDGIIGTSE
jgi:general secretion pathway protein G